MLVDIGVNLTNKRFSDDIVDVLTRANQQGVGQFVITGTSVEESQHAVELCQQFSDFHLFSTAGVHPHDAANVKASYIEELRSLANSHYVKAIGECGLDFNRNFSPQNEQLEVFEAQLQLASELSMPVFLHQRDAFSPWQALLKTYLDTIPKAVSHCFTGNLDELKQCLDMGLYIGITGWICDERRGQALYDIVKYVPEDRLMIETDAPYLTPRTIRPKPKSSRNEPAYLNYVLESVAKAMGKPIESVAKFSQDNSRAFFGLPEC